jgi:hypothetical protein
MFSEFRYENPELEAALLEISGLSNLLSDGVITTDVFTKLVTPAYARAQIIAKADEQAKIKAYGEELGFESLTTDTAGFRNAEWLRTSGKEFATGVASRCLICAVYHPEVGVAAVHKNPITLPIYVKAAIRNARLFLPDQYTHSSTMFTKEELDQFTKETIAEAFAQFDQLNPPSLKEQEVAIHIIGLDFLDPTTNPINQACADGLMEAGTFREYLGGATFQALIEAGIGGGYMYGSPDKPNPSYYAGFEIAEVR